MNTLSLHLQKNWKADFVGIMIAAMYFMAGSAHAANLYFNPSEKQVLTNEVFPVEVMIDTESQPINAAAVGITYSKSLLRLEEVSDGGSLVNYWVERPTPGDTGTVTLQGVTTAGYNGPAGKIVTLYFRALKDGVARVSYEDSSRIFLNDGKGTAAELTRGIAAITVGEGVAEDQGPLFVDTDAPEIFDAGVARAEELFEGRYFLAFSVRDSGSGVDYVEVKEGNLEYVRAESPYLLQNQNLDADIMIRAVDKVGNVKIETVKLTRSRWLEITGGVAVLLALGWFLWRRFMKK